MTSSTPNSPKSTTTRKTKSPLNPAGRFHAAAIRKNCTPAGKTGVHVFSDVSDLANDLATFSLHYWD
jgi:hypothetical protein